MPDLLDTASLTWVDSEPSATLPLPDRGLEFGDGLFETFLLGSGRAVFTELHLARLGRGLDTLGFPDCMDRVRSQLALAEETVASAGWAWAALRLTVTRGSGPRGYASPVECHPRIVATATALDRDCLAMMAPARLVTSSVELGVQPRLAGLKHLNRLEQVLAANEARARGAHEALVKAAGGGVIGVSSGNIFVVSGGRLFTPPVTRCGIAGTRREKILADWAPTIGCDIQQCTLDIVDIERADEVFYCNSLIGLRPVGAFGAAAWHRHPVCERLFAVYRAELA